MLFLSFAEVYFQNQLFQKILSGIPSECLLNSLGIDQA